MLRVAQHDTILVARATLSMPRHKADSGMRRI
jgi:hypothetical protein